MSGRHPTSAEVRGIDVRSTLRALLLGGGYLFMTFFGLVALAVSSTRELLGGRGLLVAMLLVAGGAGALMVLHDWWFVRHRPGAAIGTAPSGRPAVVLRRSPFRTVTSVVVTLTFFVVLLVTAVSLAAAQPLGAAACAALALVLLWPLVPAALGRVRPGGLYLTATGLEHRRDAVSWSLRWEQVAGAAPGDPLGLVLQPGEQLVPTRTARWVWDREVGAPPGTVGVECRSLALDGVLVAAAINIAVAFPQRRAELGTPAAMQWDLFGPP